MTRTELATVEEGHSVVGFQPENASQAARLSKWLAASALLPTALRHRPADVLVILITGHELQLSPMQAIRSISIIEGKPTMDAALMVALVKRSSECEYFRLVESTNEKAIYETMPKGAPKATRMEYTKEDAERAGLWGRKTWQRHPAAMLRARCSAALARAEFPHLTLGLYTNDEGEDIRQSKKITVEVGSGEPLPQNTPQEDLPPDSGVIDVTEGEDGIHEEPEPEPTPRVISAKQVKLFWARCRARAEPMETITGEDIAASILEAYEWSKTTEIPTSQFERVLEIVEAWEPA